MKIEEGLTTRKNEIESLQSDISKLEERASNLKDVVKEYNELKQQAASLKKEKRAKEKEYNTVISFFQNVDDTYITKIFPLFKTLDAAVADQEACHEG